ncbi:hypothetical protein L208DRAFT_1274042, partial [Tricholoma matsutake]
NDGHHYSVPHFMIPTTHQVMNAYCQKLELDVHNADGGSFIITMLPYYLVAHNQLTLPANPDLTDRELSSCHAEVKALQYQLGTSYKDASHCLYMAEVEKLEQQDITLKTYATLKERVENKLKSFERRFSEIMPSSHSDAMANPPADSQ